MADDNDVDDQQMTEFILGGSETEPNYNREINKKSPKVFEHEAQWDRMTCDDDGNDPKEFMYTPEENPSGEDYVEYVEEIEDGGDVQTEKLVGHTLVLYKGEEGQSTDTYYCLQCATSYDTILGFCQDHDGGTPEEISTECEEVILNQEWEAVDNLSEESYIEQENIKTEVQEDGEELNNEVIEYVDDGEQEECKVDPTYGTIYLEEAEGDQQEPGGVVTKEDYLCENCHSVFDDLKMAQSHRCMASPSLNAINRRLYHTEDEHLTTLSYQCPSCPKFYTTVRALNSHKRMHKDKPKNSDDDKNADGEGQSSISCDICNTKFRTEKNLKLHMKIHDKRKVKSIHEALPEGCKLQYNEMDQFYCEICEKSFDQHLLTVHKNMHLSVEEFRCGICNRRFENSPSFEMHMQLHGDKTYHESRRPPIQRQCMIGLKNVFPCQYCDKVFPRPHEKVRHERVHTGEKPYGCEVCGKTFRVPYSLTLHLRTHTNIRPYVCNVCHKRFKSQPVYAHHLKIHQNERAYKCDICPKAFRTAVQLSAHRNSHTKPFNCIECNRPFASLYAVKIHMKTHSKSDKASENLKHRCTICGAVYARIFALRYHLKEKHALDVGNYRDGRNLSAIEQYAESGDIVEDADDDSILIVATEDLEDSYDITEMTEEDESRVAAQHLSVENAQNQNSPEMTVEIETESETYE